MKFSRLQLTNFTVFEDTTFDFCSGLNILIGANGTGKSHVLKAAYSILKRRDPSFLFAKQVDRSEHRTVGLQESVNGPLFPFSEVFQLEPEELIRNSSDRFNALVANEIQSNKRREEIEYSNKVGARLHIGLEHDADDESTCVFIPPREFLAAYAGFIPAYLKRELAFDRTYFDLCVQLSESRLRGESAKWGTSVARTIESALPGRVELKDGKFYVGAFQAHAVAEGHRKLAMLIQLLSNGGIVSGSTLFWDEPESGLNPKLVKIVADVLIMLAEEGVQVVLATHDYLLTQELSLAAEYQTTTVPIRFFCLTRPDSDSPVQVQVGGMLPDLDHNPIQEEFTALYDRELDLFYGKPPSPAEA